MIQQIVDVLYGLLGLCMKGEPSVMGSHVSQIGNLVEDDYFLYP